MSCGLTRHRGGSPWMSLTLLFSLPLPHPLRGGRSLPGHPGHYSVPVHLSALPLVGRVSVSERPLKDLVGVSGPRTRYRPPPKEMISSPLPTLSRDHTPSPLPSGTPCRQDPRLLTVHDGAPHSGMVAAKLPHQSPRLLGGYLPMKLLPEAPDALLQLGWGDRGSDGGRRGAIAPPPSLGILFSRPELDPWF